MIITTLNSTYEIHRHEGRFRRVGGAPRQDAPPIGVWSSFERMSPVEPGAPVRFFTLSGDPRRLSSLKTVTTAPVVAVIDGEKDRHQVATAG